MIKDIISRLNLDLTSYSVLTEVGSGNYLFTPIIAAIANAKKVMVWTSTTEFGRADLLIEECNEILNKIGLSSAVEFYAGNKNIDHLMQADLITNSYHLRPLNRDKLMYCKSSAVIPLMYEKWELRNSDIDINYCRKRHIKVAGTWESHPLLNVFRNIGPLVLKMALEAGYEVLGNKVVVWSDDSFGEVIVESLHKFGSKEVVLTTSFEVLCANMKDLDFIIFSDYSESRNYTDNSFFNFSKLKEINPYFGIIHLYGEFDESVLCELDLFYYPKKAGKSQKMSFTLSHLGPKPILELQVAGFKVGELLLKGIKDDLIQPISFGA